MPAPALKHLKLTDVDGVTLVEFLDSGLLYESSLVGEIGQELHSLVNDQGRTHLLLDFSPVQYLSSTMLAQLAKLQKEIDLAKGQLRLIGLGPVLLDAFKIGRFERLFSIYDDRASAMKSFH